jgi:hypothetical protein
MRLSIPLLVALAVALPAAAQRMPANPPPQVERAELPPPGAASPPWPREGAGSSSEARDDVAIFREFQAWLKEQRPPIPERKPTRRADEGSGR